MKQERQSKMKEGKENDDEFVVSYVELLDLELPEEKRKLEDKEMVNLCSEFLDAGMDPTSTALECSGGTKNLYLGGSCINFFFLCTYEM